jgi:hypothetical protein
VTRASGEGQRRALQNGDSHRRNQPHTQEGQLEAGAEQSSRIDDHEAQGGGSDRIEHRLLAIEQPRPKIETEHQRGSPDGRAECGQEGIRPIRETVTVPAIRSLIRSRRRNQNVTRARILTFIPETTSTW